MDPTTTGPATSATFVRKPGLFINGNYRRLWLGHTISIFGDFIFDTTLVIWIAAVIARGQTWAPLAVSGVFIATTIPVLIVGPIAGVFVDRWNKRRTMLVMDAARAALVALLILTSGVVPLPFLPGGRLPLLWQLGVVYGVVFLLNTLSQFFRPASLALIGDIVPEETQARAMGLSQTSMSIAMILGPTLAAPLFVAFGSEWALGIDALSFVASYLLIRTVAAPPAARSVADGARPNFWREFGGGLRYFFRSRVLVVLTISATIVMLGGGALNTLDFFFVTGNLHASASYFGALQGVMGVGMILGAILASAFAQKIGLVRTLWLSLLGMALLITAYARSTDIWVAIAIIGVAGIPQAALNVAAGPLLLQSTPREMVGRVSRFSTRRLRSRPSSAPRWAAISTAHSCAASRRPCSASISARWTPSSRARDLSRWLARSLRHSASGASSHRCGSLNSLARRPRPWRYRSRRSPPRRRSLC